MSPAPFAILNLIGAAGRMIGGSRQSSMSKSDLAELDFDKLLDKARTGDMASGKQVVLGSGVEAELTPEQMQRLAAAADRAAAHGAETALVMMDGQAYKLDVSARTIENVVNEQEASVLTGIDAVITAPHVAEAASVPSAMPTNPSLMQMLADAGH